MTRTIKEVALSNDPKIQLRAVLFNEEEKIAKEKNKKQFITTQDATLYVIMEDDTAVVLEAPSGYVFDGATIPFNIGKGNMRLPIPALFHDIMCDDKSLIDYNRKLSSQIFKACLLKCGVNKLVAQDMYLAVDNFQKFQNWKPK